MTKLLFLGVHPRGRNPSQRYRFEVFEPHLRQAGFEVTYASALSDDDARDFQIPGSLFTKGRVALRGLARRLLSLTRRADVIFVQREAFFLGPAWSETLASLRAPVVFDFDDALWLHAISDANRRFGWLKDTAKFSRIIARAHTVIAGNELLANWARAYSRNVHIIPTCVDTTWFSPTPDKPPRDTVTPAWSGSPSTFNHLQTLLPALTELKNHYKEKLALRIMGDASFTWAPLKLRAEAWTPESERSLLRDADIGVMPLPDDEWSRGKCGFKGLVSMAMGLATVMSPVGVNTRIITHGQNGLLAATHDDWVQQLSSLIDDAALRQRLGVAGRQTVEQHYSVQRHAPTLVELLRRVV